MTDLAVGYTPANTCRGKRRANPGIRTKPLGGKCSAGVAGLLRVFATKPGQRMFLKSVCTSPPTGDAARQVFEAFPASKGARRDALRVTQSLEPSVTLDAVDALEAFPKPVLLAWGDSDKLFPLAHAHRLEAGFPDAHLGVIAGSSTFVMLDRPDELAAAISSFVTSGTARNER
jgi:pimeloyl-ACP methyl ester carboxylesterase